MVIFDTLDKYWEPMTRGSRAYSSCTLQAQLLSTKPLGIVTWTAQAAQWSMLSFLLRGGLPSYDNSFLSELSLKHFMGASLEIFVGVSPLPSGVSKSSLQRHAYHHQNCLCTSLTEEEESSAKRRKREDRKAALAQSMAEIQQLTYDL